MKLSAIHHQIDFSHLFGKGKNHQRTIWVSEAASGAVGTADSPPIQEEEVLFFFPRLLTYFPPLLSCAVEILVYLCPLLYLPGRGLCNNLGAVQLTENGGKQVGFYSWNLKQSISSPLKPELLSFGTGGANRFLLGKAKKKKSVKGFFIILFVYFMHSKH